MAAWSQTPIARRLESAARGIEAARDAKAARALIPEHLPDTVDNELDTLRESLAQAKGSATSERREAAKVLRELSRVAAYAPTQGAPAIAAAIERAPEYRIGPEDAKSSWLGRAISALIDWISKHFRNDDSSSSGPNLPNFQLPGWITSVVWLLLAAVIVGAAIPLLLLLTRRLQRRARKKRGGLLEDEPERTKDEYLALADGLAAKGEYREAIRMLYLATLKRFDEARVARFDRGETNWEHLYRIEASPKLPTGLDFRPATKAFDLHWYGQRPAGPEEYARFQGWYGEVERRLREAPAPASGAAK